uniref:Uncharacterized protein n=1 Tax=Physcomitrium patens TaxID=3218 RepID=A0A2K1IWM2_PHYPA|nr:hypothetical protein PHYPA_023496 [Physcomitrium patens]
MHDAEAPRDDALCGVYQRSYSFWGICNVTIGDTIVSGVVFKAALTDASGVGTNVVCGSLVEVEDGTNIDFINNDLNGRRASGAIGGEWAKI